jgi:hypothetical protein
MTPEPSSSVEEPTPKAIETAPKKAAMPLALVALLGIGAVALGAGTYGVLGNRHHAAPATSGSAATIFPSTVQRQPGEPGPSGSATPYQRAGALRREATVLCKSQQWAKCAANLDQAAVLDPSGEVSVVIQRLHDVAYRGLHPDAAAGPTAR